MRSMSKIQRQARGEPEYMLSAQAVVPLCLASTSLKKEKKDGGGDHKAPSHVPGLTLEFAHHCLQNAAFNLDTASTGNVTKCESLA